jgi:hypothetical protein
MVIGNVVDQEGDRVRVFPVSVCRERPSGTVKTSHTVYGDLSEIREQYPPNLQLRYLLNLHRWIFFL